MNVLNVLNQQIQIHVLLSNLNVFPPFFHLYPDNMPGKIVCTVFLNLILLLFKWFHTTEPPLPIILSKKTLYIGHIPSKFQPDLMTSFPTIARKHLHIYISPEKHTSKLICVISHQAIQCQVQNGHVFIHFHVVLGSLFRFEQKHEFF